MVRESKSGHKKGERRKVSSLSNCVITVSFHLQHRYHCALGTLNSYSYLSLLHIYLYLQRPQKDEKVEGADMGRLKTFLQNTKHVR